MTRNILLLCVLSFAVTLCLAQTSTPATPPSAAPHHGDRMAEMQQHHMDAMKAEIEKMKASLEQMKTNVAAVKNPAEKARWQSNIDLWTAMIGHMEEMSRHMEHMGTMGMGMGMHHDQSDHPTTPPADPKEPQ